MHWLFQCDPPELRRKLWSAAIVSPIWLVIGAVLSMAWLDRRPPVVQPRVYLVKPDYRPGEDLQFRYAATVTRACDGDVHRAIRARDGGWEYVFPTVEALAARTVGELPRTVEYAFTVGPLPGSIPDGQYFYSAHTEYRCNFAQWLWPIKITMPVLEFRVSRE